MDRRMVLRSSSEDRREEIVEETLTMEIGGYLVVVLGFDVRAQISRQNQIRPRRKDVGSQIAQNVCRYEIHQTE